MIGLPVAATRYFPKSPIVISFTASSTTFQSVNSGSGEGCYTFVATQDCYVKVGLSDIGAATSSDFLLQAGTHDFVLRANEGVRVLRVSADGTLQIGQSG